jgi:catechol 2,3-dioxygenase-like lactoylglutathione lyase family enzyme
MSNIQPRDAGLAPAGMAGGLSEPRVAALTPYVHVADVERSLAFYRLLGFSVDSRHPAPAAPGGPTPRTVWASASCGGARIMFALASGRVDPETQAVLFYVHTKDVTGLRRHLLASGVIDAGDYDPESPARRSALWGTASAAGLVSTIRRPFYMPEGEMRVEDPDGYTLLVGQVG